MKVLFSLLLSLVILTGLAQMPMDAEGIFRRAVELDRPVLLVFSGSDWCTNCIRFKKEVLNDTAFQAYAKEKLLALNADFPQRTQLPQATVQQNEALAEKYNPQGAFPHIVLLGPDRSLIANIPYMRQSAEEFIKQLAPFVDKPMSPFREYKKRTPAMGSFFEFIIVEAYNNEARAWEVINECTAEVARIENLISEWKETSQVSQVNQNAGIRPVVVSPELYKLFERSINIGYLTQGAFDITFQGLNRFWRFDGSQRQPPDSVELTRALRLIDYRKIQLLDSNKVFLPEKGMAISFGGIGQGYAVDRVKDLLLGQGMDNFVINSSGDIFAHGLKADGTPWKVGVADPFNKEKIIRWLEVDDRAVVTSGNYEKYFEHEGIRYAHIIDPKTGWPTRGVVSTTVIAPNTEIADALATSLFILGIDVGMDLVDQLPGVHCIIIDENKKVYYSKELINEK